MIERLVETRPKLVVIDHDLLAGRELDRVIIERIGGVLDRATAGASEIVALQPQALALKQRRERARADDVVAGIFPENASSQTAGD